MQSLSQHKYFAAFRKSFLGKAFMLASSAAVGQLILLLCYPIITRIYTPDDFGLYAVFSALLAILASISAWRYNAIVPFVDEPKEARNLLILCFYAVIITAAIAGFVIWVMGGYITPLLNIEALTPILWLLPVGVICSGFYLSIFGYIIRGSRFRLIARARIYQSTCQAGSQVVFGLWGVGPLGLVIGDVLGRAVGAARLVRGYSHNKLGTTLRNASPEDLIDTARLHQKLPLWSTWSTLASEISQHIPLLILSATYGRDVAGWFGFATLIVVGPASLVAQATSNVFLANARVAYARNALAGYTVSVFRELCACAIAPLMLFAIVAPQLFPVIFGEQWKFSGDIAQLLAPYVVLLIVTGHIQNIVLVKRLQTGEFVFQISLLVCRLGILIWGSQHWSAYNTLVGYVVVSMLMLGAYHVWLLQKADCRLGSIFRIFANELLMSALLTTPALLGYYFFSETGGLILTVACLIAILIRLVRTISSLVELDSLSHSS